MVRLFCCFPCSWKSFRCFYFNSNCLPSFLIGFSAKNWFSFMIESVLCSNLLSASSGNSRERIFWFCCYYEFDVCNFRSHYYNDLINLLQSFWWFYCVDRKDIILVWFRLLVCMNYFKLLFVLITLVNRSG